MMSDIVTTPTSFSESSTTHTRCTAESIILWQASQMVLWEVTVTGSLESSYFSSNSEMDKTTSPILSLFKTRQSEDDKDPTTFPLSTTGKASTWRLYISRKADTTLVEGCTVYIFEINRNMKEEEKYNMIVKTKTERTNSLGHNLIFATIAQKILNNVSWGEKIWLVFWRNESVVDSSGESIRNSTETHPRSVSFP